VATPDRAAVRSAACVASPPLLADDREWFIPEAGRGVRRGVRAGEHLEPGHPLAVAFPECFTASAEPVDCWPVGVPDEDARKRRQAEQLRLAPSLARRVTPVCLRCGAQSEQAVVLVDQPQALDLISELSGLVDHDPASITERLRIEGRYAEMARQHQERERELAVAENAWRTLHVACPEGTPELAAPSVPDHPALHYRLPTVRTLG
jgi:hypothetical protein